MTAKSASHRKGSANELRINGVRLFKTIQTTAQFGAIPGSQGLTRLALSESDKAVREWFIAEASALGCVVRIDEIGNIFACLPGLDSARPPIAIGSHLDTQPQGGRFDGILGVLGALEVLRTIKESGVRTFAPIVAVNWTNEEGARFESGCTGSAVWAEHLTLQEGYALRSMTSEGETLGDALNECEFVGEEAASYRSNPFSAHLELHIEQGPRLEAAEKKVAVVTRIQANRRYRVHVRGHQSHAGSTPMESRADALVAASRIVARVEELARVTGGFGTVGILECHGGSINCIPGEVSFTIDIRHPEETIVALMEKSIVAEMDRMQLQQTQPAIQFTLDRVWESPAAQFDPTLLHCVSEAARDRLGDDMVEELGSFAGHDSAMTNLRVPTAMLFVPSRAGISHAPEEFTDPRQCADGVQVLLDSVLAYDKLLQADAMFAIMTPPSSEDDFSESIPSGGDSPGAFESSSMWTVEFEKGP